MKKAILSLLITYVSLAVVLMPKWLNRQGQVAGISSESATKVVKGLVLPHHELAHPLISQAINEVLVTGSSYSTIVLLAPNHSGEASPWAVTVSQLPELRIPSETVKVLLETTDFLADDENLILREHGVMVPGRYLQAAFPEASILPIAIAPYATEEQIEKLVELLVNYPQGNTLYVLSADMSHNSMLESALEHHQTINHVFSTFNYELLAQLNDTYLDAPTPAQVFLKILEKQQAIAWQQIAESHGAILLNKPNLNGTSYITGIFVKPPLE